MRLLLAIEYTIYGIALPVVWSWFDSTVGCGTTCGVVMVWLMLPVVDYRKTQMDIDRGATLMMQYHIECTMVDNGTI